MKILIGVIIGLVLLAAGAFASWYYFIKIRKPKKEKEAQDALDGSLANDPEREKIKKEIEARIKENERLREELKKKLSGTGKRATKKTGRTK